MFAKIEQFLEDSSYVYKDSDVRVRFYLMRALEEWRPTDRLRRHDWYPIERARLAVNPEQNKCLIDSAEKARLARIAASSAS